MKFTKEQIAELLETETKRLEREADIIKLNKALKALLIRADKKGLKINQVLFSHMVPYVERYEFR